MRFYKLFIASFLSLAAAVLTIFALLGSTSSKSPLSVIYAARVDFSKVTIQTLVPSLPPLHLTQAGIAPYYDMGLWGYCRLDANKVATSCYRQTKFQPFDLQDLIYREINIQGGIFQPGTFHPENVVLPPELQDKMNFYNAVMKCMFYTLIIGCALSIVTLFLTCFRWIIHFTPITWICRLFSILSMVCIAIAAGSATGAFVYIKNLLKKDANFLVSMNLGTKYFGLMWGAFVAAFLCMCFMCSPTKYRVAAAPPPPPPIEEKSLLSHA